MKSLSKCSLIVSGGMFVLTLMAPGVGQSAPMSIAQPPAAFAQCAGCHTTARGGAAGVGPNLFAVIDKKAGSRPGFAYSPALKKSGVIWTRATLLRFLANPASVAPGTTMPNPGLKAPAERVAVAAYLAALK